MKIYAYLYKLITNTRTPHKVLLPVNQGHNSKTKAFRVMSLVLKLHLVKMSKYEIPSLVLIPLIFYE